MTATRGQARSDLVKLFEHSFANELEDVLDMWWDDDTQATLRCAAWKRLEEERLASSPETDYSLRSSPIVVSGPCPGTTTVSSGSASTVPCKE